VATNQQGFRNRLVGELMDATGLSIETCRTIVNKLIERIQGEILVNGRADIHGFGTLKLERKFVKVPGPGFKIGTKKEMVTLPIGRIGFRCHPSFKKQIKEVIARMDGSVDNVLTEE
jgi:nucleoid DNA-binding protein